MNFPRISRRRFLLSTLAIGGASALPKWFVEHGRAFAQEPVTKSPNARPRVALIGCGGRGIGIAKEAKPFADVVAVCDVDAAHVQKAAVQFPGAKVHSDYRKLLEDTPVDVILNGTPDHWHTFINAAAMRAGKDVYSEKPLTLTIDEGKRLVQVARETKRVFQTGSQQRSDARFRLAVSLVRAGRLGKIQKVVTGLPAGPRNGPFQTGKVPDGFDWDFWQGQAPAHEYVPERAHRSFRYWLEYSGGTLTDWGAHHIDIAQWGLNLDRSGPTSVEGRALVEAIPGGFTAPSEFEVEYTFANGVSHRCESVASDGPDGSVRGQVRAGQRRHGVTFEGEEGWLYVTRGKIEASRPEILKEPLTNLPEGIIVSDNHMGNFFSCMQSRQSPICDAEIGHRSVSACHLGGIAIQLGRKLQWDPGTEEFKGDDQANSMVARNQRDRFSWNSLLG
jgi:predicted dehydrogenase